MAKKRKKDKDTIIDDPTLPVSIADAIVRLLKSRQDIDAYEMANPDDPPEGDVDQIFTRAISDIVVVWMWLACELAGSEIDTRKTGSIFTAGSTVFALASTLTQNGLVDKLHEFKDGDEDILKHLYAEVVRQFEFTKMAALHNLDLLIEGLRLCQPTPLTLVPSEG